MPKRRKTRARRNPRRSYKKRAIRRVRSTFGALNWKQALKDQIPIQLGMFGTKFFAKLFGPSATEADPASWNWTSYAKGAAGTVLASFLLQNIKPGWGQKALQGGFSLLFYKMIQNNLVQGNPWALKHFGVDQEEMDVYVPDEYAGYDPYAGYGGYDEDDLYDVDGYEPGDVEDDDEGRSYLLGDDMQWHELPEATGPMISGDSYEALTRPGPLGDVLRPVGPLGEDPVAKALLNA